MKIAFNILIVLLFLIALVPKFRRFVFHLLVGRQIVKEQKRQYQAAQRRASEGIKVDHVPTEKDRPHFRGGEYVDYEEVK